MAAEHKVLFGYQNAMEFGAFYVLRQKSNGGLFVGKFFTDTMSPVCRGSMQECIDYGVTLIKDLCGTSACDGEASQAILSAISRGPANVFIDNIVAYVGKANDKGYTFDVGLLIVIRPNDVHELYAIEGWSDYYRNVKS